MTQTISIMDLGTIQEKGTQALVRELGPVGAIRYWEMNDGGGHGDYTKEKYNYLQPSIDEIVNSISDPAIP